MMISVTLLLWAHGAIAQVAPDETFTAVQSTGWGMGIPLGLNVALTEDVLLNGGLRVNWLWDNAFFENDIFYSVNLGIAFKVGS